VRRVGVVDASGRDGGRRVEVTVQLRCRGTGREGECRAVPRGTLEDAMLSKKEIALRQALLWD
jgi:hypothetical protein